MNPFFDDIQFLSISDFLNNSKNNYSIDSIFISKTPQSYLIGPYIDKNFCDVCFVKRLKSSIFFDIQNYRTPNSIEKKKIIDFYKYNNFDYHWVIIEFTKKLNVSEFEIHHIIPISDCIRHSQ